MAPLTPSLVWTFGRCALDERRLELSVDGQLVQVEARPLELLLYLLQHAGELVTKDELLEAVWPGRIPSESVLTKAIAKLRQSIGDEDQALIRTVYGQGYRLIAEVSARAAAAVSDNAPVAQLQPGDLPPLRPHWPLERRLDHTGRNEIWLARHAKTRQPRVFKFARDAGALRALKREITVFRLLSASDALARHLLPILDWNLDEVPYFVECPYVEGGNLAQWFERGGGSAAIALEVRLELVAQIADTLAAAHDAGVLHKDVKPGNVLVDADDAGRPSVRLCDFGSGSVFDLERLARLEITRLGLTETVAAGDDSSGTPLYIAPELLSGHAPGLRSDIYALGVVLFQAAVGDFHRPLAPGWEREVGDPLLVADIAACADFDPQRRLADARVLAQRLRSLPARRIEAARAEEARIRTERLQAQVARARLRRPWLASTATVLVIGIAASMLLWRRAEHARAESAREATIAQAVNQFLTEDLLANADPGTSGRRDIPVSALLERAARTAPTRFAGEPEAESAVHAAIGKSWYGLSNYDASEGELRRAIELIANRDDLRDMQDQQRIDLAWLLFDADRLDAADEQVAWFAARAPHRHDLALQAETQGAWSAYRRGRYDEAVSRLAAQRAAYDAQLDGPDPDAAEAFFLRLGDAYNNMQRFTETVPLFQRIVAHDAKRYGVQDARSLNAMLGLGIALEYSDRNDEALGVLLEAERVARDTLGDDHDIALQIAGELAGVYDNLGRYAEARTLYEQVIATRTRRFGEGDADARVLMNNLSVTYGHLDRTVDSLALLTRLHAIETRIEGERHPRTLHVALNMGSDLATLRRWSDSVKLLGPALRIAKTALPATDADIGRIQFEFANALHELGRDEESQLEAGEAVERLTATLGADHRVTKRAAQLRDALDARNAKPAG